MNIFYTNFHQGWGGQPLQALLLAQAMRERGHAVRVFSPEGSELARRAEAAGVPVETCCSFRKGFRPVHVARDLFRLRVRAAGFLADIVHAHGSQDCWIAAAALLGRGCKAKLVRTKHNSYNTARHAANRWLYNRALAHTIAVAGPIRDELLADNFVDPGKVTVIHAGLDDNFVSSVKKTREETRASLKVPQDCKLIGLVGRLAPDKGQDTLLRAAKKIVTQVPSAHFVLVGTGGDWDRIKSLIAELALGERVTWAGFRDDVPDVTAALDVSILAARACDASSTVVKEALVLGVPVVATDVGGTAEILENGDCGLLVRPGDADSLAQGIIDTIATDNTVTTALRVERGRERVRDFLASAVAAKTEEIYRQALSQG